MCEEKREKSTRSNRCKITVLSLFPGYFRGPFDESILKRAQEKGLLEIELMDLRAFAEDKHKKVDDRPCGGGPGMVLKPDVVAKAIRHVKGEDSKVIYLSPQGQKLNAAKSRALSEEKHLILLCGHYEGVDERVLENLVDEEVSIGDYVLTNGCIAAIVIVDTLVRFIPGVLGNEETAASESFESGWLDHPHYTKPIDFEGHRVPEVLLSGNHKKIEHWRCEKAMEKTKRMRPDLYGRSQT